MRGSSHAIPSLRWGASWTVVGAVAQAGYQWAVTILLARLCTPVIVGQYALALAIVTPILTFTSLQLRTVQVTDTREEYRFFDYFSVRMVGNALGIVAVVAFVAASRVDLQTGLAVLIIAAAKATDGLSDVYYGLWQKKEMLELIGASRVFRAVSSLILVVVAVWWARSVVAAATCLLVGSLLTLFVYDVRRTERRLPGAWRNWHWPSTTIARALVVACLPLGLVTALNALLFNIPRLFLENFWGAAALGYYSAVSYLTLAGGIGVNAVSEAALHRLAYFFVHEPREYERLVKRLMLIPFALLVAGVLVVHFWGQAILSLTYGPAYARNDNVFLLLMIAGGLMYLTQSLGASVTAARYFRVQVITSIAGVVTSIALCVYLVPTVSLVGAAWASIASYLVMLLVVCGITSHAFRSVRKRSCDLPTNPTIQTDKS